MKTILLCLLLSMSCGKENSIEKEAQVYTDSVVTDQYLTLLNNHRSRMGLRPLELSPNIEQAALIHAQDMGQGRRAFGHGGWQDRCQKIRRELGQGNACGEVIARGQETPEDVFSAWLKSPGHRRIIEGAAYTHTGLGFVRGKDGSIYWTQILLEI
jgi:uncharacterized protein YkwD